MKKLHLQLLIFVTFIIASMPLLANTAMESTTQLIDAMLNVKEGDEKSYQKIDRFINYDIITTKTIEPHKTKFTPQQSAELKKNLTHLIRTVAYPRSGSYYRDSKYTFGKPRTSQGKTIVTQDTYLPKEDLEMEIGYQWEKVDGQWMITDITFDEDSMIKDYQNQFGRIIGKNGVDGLLKKVEDKIKEMDKSK